MSRLLNHSIGSPLNASSSATRVDWPVKPYAARAIFALTSPVMPTTTSPFNFTRPVFARLTALKSSTMYEPDATLS